MSRPLRIEFPGAWYHLMNRGRRGERVYASDSDFQEFIHLLKETSEVFNLRVASYCLMSNHYHILAQTPEGNLSRCMRHLNGIYTQRYNRRHNTEGQVFRGRYKAIVVEEQEYLMGLVRYIHRNPVRSGLVDSVDEYSWSSHKGFLSSSKGWKWLYKEPVLEQFGDTYSKQKQAYRQFMQEEDSEEIERVFSLRKLPVCLGSDRFMEWIKEAFFRGGVDNQVPDSRWLAPDQERIIKAVCDAYQVDEESLYRFRKGKLNEPRNVAIYLLRTLRGENMANLAERFNLKTYSSVSSAARRVQRALNEEGETAEKVRELANRFKLGQTKT